MAGHTDQMIPLLQADELGLRLEIVGGLPLWEAHPRLIHQEAIDRIRASITSSGRDFKCACYHVSDVYIRFHDGSLKRPDVSIYCSRPSEEDEAVATSPEAVIEVVNTGFEAKDLEIGPRFYLSQGVKDVVVFDPTTLLVLHVRRDGAARLVSPAAIALECGCQCIV